MNITQALLRLNASALVCLVPGLALAQPAPPAAVPPAPPTAAPAAPATAGPAAAPAVPTPAATVPPAAEPPPAAPAPPAPAAIPPAPPAATVPPPIQLATAPDEQENRERAERAATNKRAAVKSSPFMDATLNGTWLEDRFGDPFVFGVQGGAYLGEIVRLTVRLEMPTENARDDYGDYAPTAALPNGAWSSTRRSDPPTLLYGATLGVVATSSENFVFSPGLVFVRSDVSDYGSMLGISMPFEWVTSRGMRFGLELDLGRSFGGTVQTETCLNNFTPCTITDSDRGAGRAFALRFHMGFGFNRPR